MAAANGGLTEVALGRIAQQKASNPQVKSFGAMMVEDHSKAGEELKKIGAAHFVTLPEKPTGGEQNLIDELSAKSGRDFDKAYVDAVLKDHEDDINEFIDAAKVITYPDLLKFNKNTLPVLHKHLDAIKAIKSQ